MWPKAEAFKNGASDYFTKDIGFAHFTRIIVVMKEELRSVEKVFLFATALYVSYIVSGILVKPDWKEAAIYSVRPVLMLDPGYIAILIGMVGTSVAPWMQFYLQAAIVEKVVLNENVVPKFEITGAFTVDAALVGLPTQVVPLLARAYEHVAEVDAVPGQRGDFCFPAGDIRQRRVIFQC